MAYKPLLFEPSQQDVTTLSGSLKRLGGLAASSIANIATTSATGIANAFSDDRAPGQKYADSVDAVKQQLGVANKAQPIATPAPIAAPPITQPVAQPVAGYKKKKNTTLATNSFVPEESVAPNARQVQNIAQTPDMPTDTELNRRLSSVGFLNSIEPPPNSTRQQKFTALGNNLTDLEAINTFFQPEQLPGLQGTTAPIAFPARTTPAQASDIAGLGFKPGGEVKGMDGVIDNGTTASAFNSRNRIATPIAVPTGTTPDQASDIAGLGFKPGEEVKVMDGGKTKYYGGARMTAYDPAKGIATLHQIPGTAQEYSSPVTVDRANAVQQGQQLFIDNNHTNSQTAANNAEASRRIAEATIGIPASAKYHTDTGKASLMKAQSETRGTKDKTTQESYNVYEKAKRDYLEVVKRNPDDTRTTDELLREADIYGSNAARDYVNAIIASRKKKNKITPRDVTS